MINYPEYYYEDIDKIETSTKTLADNPTTETITARTATTDMAKDRRAPDTSNIKSTTATTTTTTTTTTTVTNDKASDTATTSLICFFAALALLLIGAFILLWCRCRKPEEEPSPTGFCNPLYVGPPC